MWLPYFCLPFTFHGIFHSHLPFTCHHPPSHTTPKATLSASLAGIASSSLTSTSPLSITTRAKNATTSTVPIEVHATTVTVSTNVHMPINRTTTTEVHTTTVTVSAIGHMPINRTITVTPSPTLQATFDHANTTRQTSFITSKVPGKGHMMNYHRVMNYNRTISAIPSSTTQLSSYLSTTPQPIGSGMYKAPTTGHTRKNITTIAVSSPTLQQTPLPLNTTWPTGSDTYTPRIVTVPTRVHTTKNRTTTITVVSTSPTAAIIVAPDNTTTPSVPGNSTSDADDDRANINTTNNTLILHRRPHGRIMLAKRASALPPSGYPQGFDDGRAIGRTDILRSLYRRGWYDGYIAGHHSHYTTPHTASGEPIFPWEKPGLQVWEADPRMKELGQLDHEANVMVANEEHRAQMKALSSVDFGTEYMRGWREGRSEGAEDFKSDLKTYKQGYEDAWGVGVKAGIEDETAKGKRNDAKAGPANMTKLEKMAKTAAAMNVAGLADKAPTTRPRHTSSSIRTAKPLINWNCVVGVVGVVGFGLGWVSWLLWI